jgi:hypothetical protein
MTMMLNPDLLDRRALALLAFVDAYGRPLQASVQIEGEGVKMVAKGNGQYAVLAAKGLEAHTAAFLAPPGAPALRSLHIQLDCTPLTRTLAPRRFDLRLPRDPDPTHREQPNSLFQPVPIEILPTAAGPVTGSAAVLRVSVTRSGDGKTIEGALVRAQTDNGLFAARALTDARGEACLLFAALPLSFAGAGATVDPDTPARVTVDVDPAVARFHAPADIPAAVTEAAGRTTGLIDPDALAAALPADFPSGTALRVAAGRQLSLALTWTAP